MARDRLPKAERALKKAEAAVRRNCGFGGRKLRMKKCKASLARLYKSARKVR